MTQDRPQDWRIFRGDGLDKNAAPHERLRYLPDPPAWRDFQHDLDGWRGENFEPEEEEIERVNAALYLRRPLLITGRPGTGKTSLTYAVARELELGPVLRWSITSRTALQDGLYRYDAIARLQDSEKGGERPALSDYLNLGPLASAFFPMPHADKNRYTYENSAGEKRNCPRVLLIDEIDKSDIDLPNDLLHIFEEGRFEIPELKRLAKQKGETEKGENIRLYDSDETVEIINGEVKCTAFPLVVMTSNGEREFPPAFLRRCLHLEMKPARNTAENPKLTNIVKAHLGLGDDAETEALIREIIDSFLSKRGDMPDGKGEIRQDLAADQLLNAIYLTLNGLDDIQSREALLDALWRPLSES
ncbi:MAG: AAA family ATPase [Gammaproteobacteria bacterium]|nr:AAA family ATPase [Gammaproteobacteria bacterium]